MSDITYPTVELKLKPPKGKSADIDVTPWLRSLSYVSSADKIGKLSLSLSVPATEKLGPQGGTRKPIKDFQTLCFLPGGTYEVTFKDVDNKGSGDDVTYKGDIVLVRHTLNDGRWVLSLEGLEALHRLKGDTITFQPEPDTTRQDNVKKLMEEFAKKIGSTAKLGKAKSTAEGTIAYYTDSALSILKTIADQMGMVVSYDAEKKEIALTEHGAGATVKVVYGIDISGVNLTLDISDQPSEYHVTPMADGAKASVVAFKKIATVPGKQDAKHMGLALRNAAFGKQIRTEPLDGTASLGLGNNTEGATRMATRELLDLSRKFATGSLTCRGKPLAKANGLLTIEDAPWPLGGTFVISSVTHSWSPDEGFQTELEFHANAVAKPS